MPLSLPLFLFLSSILVISSLFERDKSISLLSVSLSAPLLPALLLVPLSTRLRPVFPPSIFDFDPIGPLVIAGVEVGVRVEATKFPGFFRPLTNRRNPLRMSPRVARPRPGTRDRKNRGNGSRKA